MGRSGYTCVRHCFCTLNATMWLVGCSVLGVGIWLRLAYGGYASLLPQYSMVSLDSLCIATGVIMFIVAFFGCCGAWFQSRCMLITYFSLVIMVFMLEFIIATLAFVYRETLTQTVKQELLVGIQEQYNTSDTNSLGLTWRHIHTEFQCCGVEGYEDWFDIKAWPGKSIVPYSCCRLDYQHLPDCTRNSTLWHQDGCAVQMQKWFVERLHIVGIVGLVVAFVQLFGLICSMLLFCTVTHKRKSRTYRSYESAT